MAHPGSPAKQAVYVDDVEVIHPLTKESVTLNVWMVPGDGRLFAISNMKLPVAINAVTNPYDHETWLRFHDTFSGLPK